MLLVLLLTYSMKKQLLLFCFLLAAKIGIAQIEAGTILVGGDASYFQQTTKTEDAQLDYTATYSNFSLQPKAGFFISENLVIGMGLSLSKNAAESKTNNPSYQTNKNTVQMVGFSPFSRYYKMLGERAGFFGQLTGSFLKGTSKTEGETTHKFNSASLGLAPGFVFFATPKISLETTIGYLGYQYQKYKTGVNSPSNVTESTTNGFSAGVNASNVYLGINFYFGR